MHWLDRLGGLVFVVDRQRTVVFPDGWGDRLTIELLDHPLDPSDPLEEVDIVWARKEEHRGYRSTRGTFSSPLGELLPVAARAVPLEMVEPGAGTDRTVVLLPAWNDHGTDVRHRFAVLLAQHGIASVRFDIPFYGSRRAAPVNRQAIRTVADFALMGHGAIREARALLNALRGRGHLGVTGYSMGGNLAAYVSSVVPYPVAVTPLAASHGPGPVFLDGMISRAVDWKALGGKSARDDLRGVLSGVSVLDLPARPHHATAVLVAATRDGFVPPEATTALAEHWQGSEIRWVDAGHGTLLARHRPLMAGAVARSFQRTFDRAVS